MDKQTTETGRDTAYLSYLQGLACLTGSGRSKNGKLAMQYFQEAADEGLVEALYELGRCHLSDTLSIHKPKKGFALLREAARAGFTPAQYETGLCYKKGLGTKRNLKQSLKWLLMAQQQGAVNATSELEEVQLWIEQPEMIPVPPPDEGMQHYRIARKQGQKGIQFYGKRLDYKRWKDSENWDANACTYEIYGSDDGRYIVIITKEGIRETVSGGGGSCYGQFSMRKVQVFKNHDDAAHFAQHGFSPYYPEDQQA